MSFTSYGSTIIAVPPWPAAAPLLVGLERRSDMIVKVLDLDDIVEGVEHGTITCALLPPTLLIRLPGLSILPGAGLAARPGAATERILTDAPLADIRAMAVPPGLESLALYVDLCFMLQGWPVPARCTPGEPSDAPALCSALNAAPATAPGHDIAELWEGCTGLPLVLAAWACTGPTHTRRLRQLLAESAREGASGDGASEAPYRYEVLSGECECLRRLHQLCRAHAIGEATAESMAFC